jgi:mono/diheme cytochrome c family protein
MFQHHRSHHVRSPRSILAGAALLLAVAVALISAPRAAPQVSAAEDQVARGKEIFRFDTFGDEQHWTNQLRLHEAIESSLSPQLALQLGLKVVVDALPDEIVQAILFGLVDLTDPAVTVALIKLDAVLGVMGTVETVNGVDRLTRVGITCALCHSTVDDSLVTGIGSRLDGWPNVDLDPGKIIAAAPGTDDAKRPIYNSWGPGKYDPRFNIDGISTPLVLPPAFGLADVDKETYTAEGPISYWNKYVAITQMGGRGTFIDPRLGIKVVRTPNLVQPKLSALREYQFSLETPPPPENSFDVEAAARGKAVFKGAGKCATCHIPPLYTDVNLGRLHLARETGMDPAYALRTTTKRYRTTPLRALWQHPPYFHDGSAATLADVVEHYNTFLELGLTDAQKADLVEFLKSI